MGFSGRKQSFHLCPAAPCPQADSEANLSHSEHDHKPLRIVGIGASAGNPDAMERLFQDIPADSLERKVLRVYDTLLEKHIPPGALIDENCRRYVAGLVAELRTTREDFLFILKNLQATVDEFNFTHEELRSADREFLSAERADRLNEELQKANVDLETSRAKLETQNNELEMTCRKLKAEIVELGRAMDELRLKEGTLLQQSRIAAMGEMLNNISHQWRQPLNSVGLLIQQIWLSHKFGKFSRELLDANITKAMEMLLHMSQTIDDFRGFFLPDKEKIRFKVDDSVRKTISLVEDNFTARGITIEVGATGAPERFGYPNEFSQALLNIMMNARDAILERGVTDGRITVRSREEEGRAVVTIKDNAGGIDEEILDRIFDPYFSTKETGKGTGIGLFMSSVMVEKNMGGRLTVRNVGDGAEFRVEV